MVPCSHLAHGFLLLPGFPSLHSSCFVYSWFRPLLPPQTANILEPSILKFPRISSGCAGSGAARSKGTGGGGREPVSSNVPSRRAVAVPSHICSSARYRLASRLCVVVTCVLLSCVFEPSSFSKSVGGWGLRLREFEGFAGGGAHTER